MAMAAVMPAQQIRTCDPLQTQLLLLNYVIRGSIIIFILLVFLSLSFGRL
jgi:hypothetical protein